MNNNLILKAVCGAILFFSASFGGAFAQDKSAGDAKKIEQMSKRITDLESQILNMQVMIGTLESLVKQQRSSAASQAPGQAGGFGQQSEGTQGSDRIEILETQVRALAAQVEQLTGNSASGNIPAGQRSGSSNANFGDTNIARSNSERRIGSSQLASVPAQEGEEGESIMMYEQAKSHLLRRDYASAETAFRDFLGKYKKDALAGEAQYWLGESYYKQKKFRKAADSFLKGYSKYRKSKKAPNSLFKLALALNQLGQKDAACTTFTELRKTFPDMEGNLLQRVNREVQRIKC